MSRLPLWVPRLFAAGVPALLLAALLGCGRQHDAEVAQAPKAHDVAPAANPAPAKPADAPADPGDSKNREIKDLNEAIAKVEPLKRDQESLKAKTGEAAATLSAPGRPAA